VPRAFPYPLVASTGLAKRDLPQTAQHKESPRKDPNQKKAPENQERNFVVVARHAQIQIPVNLLVNEIKPEKPFGLTLRRIRIVASTCHGAAAAKNIAVVEASLIRNK